MNKEKGLRIGQRMCEKGFDGALIVAVICLGGGMLASLFRDLIKTKKNK